MIQVKCNETLNSGKNALYLEKQIKKKQHLGIKLTKR